MSVNNNQYDKLLSWLTKMLRPEFDDRVRGFVQEVGNLNLIEEPLDRMSIGSFLGRAQKLELLSDLEAYLLRTTPKLKDLSVPEPPIALTTPRVPFTNRETEISEIVLINSTPMRTFLISAPAGFGKSDLLEQLEEKFTERGWQHALIRLARDSSISELTQALAGKLQIRLTPQSKTPGSWGKRLSSAWKKRHPRFGLEGEKHLNGIVLLIDFEGEPSFELLQYLLETFIPDFQNNLKTLVPFSTGKTWLHFIIAGRSLEQIKILNLPTIRYLSPFDYTIVRRSTRDYLKSETDETIDQISAHVLHLTGGHPGCMAQTLQYYQEESLTPDDFLLNYEIDIWKQIVRNAVEKFDQELLQHNGYLRDIIESLSVFRYLDTEVLRRMIEKYKPAKVRDAYDLQKKLTSTYLFSKKGRYLKDSICRQLFLIRLRNENQQRLLEVCREALNICLERIINSQNPEKWILEYLFQVLQLASHNNLRDQNYRISLREEFMNVHVSTVMQTLLDRQQSNDEVRDNMADLLYDIRSEEHWEFRFAVNYYLRDNQYTDQPLRTLEEHLAAIVL